MNVVTRGVRNALRSPLRSGAIVLMLAISIGLILCMLVALSGVNTKIEEVKASAGTAITITPAGVSGFDGGGDPLTTDQVDIITNTDNIVSVSSSLSDQLGEDDTNLESALELGSFGQRQQRFDSSSTPSTSTEDSNNTPTNMPSMTSRTTVTGTTDPSSVSTSGGELTLDSGELFDGTSSDNIALIGSDLAEKNSLTVGDTFSAYDQTISVIGIFTTDNAFQDSGIIMPLATIQNLTDQAGAVTSITAVVNSSDNVADTVTSLKSSLGDEADITSQVEQAEASVESLESISSLAMAGVVVAAIAGAAIILLAMIMVARERRREIGVIKAIGGSNIKVIGQFIAEALTLTIIGTVIGFVVGIAASGPITSSLVDNSQSSSSQDSSERTGAPSGQPSGESGGAGQMVRGGFEQMNSNLTAVTSELSPQIFITAIGITLLIAIIGSAVPAWFIARIRPAEVLRTE